MPTSGPTSGAYVGGITYSLSNATTSGSTMSGIWDNWSATSTAACVTWTFTTTNGYTQSIPYHHEPETPEQQAARETEYKKAQDNARLAKERAEELLRDFLTAEQIAELTKSDYFEMVSGTGKRYRVHRGRQGNVYLIGEQGKATRRYCIHPDLAVPDADTMLAQKLLLEANEKEFLKLANETVLA